ncbi:hypothetical protein ANN_27229 [Periplaneta americana]|uniref:Uncharacterized protein n=1 Tax=Periplaneta americana TaxID=6978 RepID=A0ABQ8RXK7_PERAM|nr:hypothetical protein ANN_27229 [Periplaneta americana]
MDVETSIEPEDIARQACSAKTNKKRSCPTESGGRKNNTETAQEEKKKLAGSLAEKNCLLKNQDGDFIADFISDADYNTFEEVHGLSVTGSTIDIIAFTTRSGFIIDPTVRFETNEEQPAEVDKKKEYLQSYHSILPPKIPARKELEVIGLLFGARGTATLFMKDVFKRLGIPTSIIPIVTLAALKGSIALLRHHLYSK